jgi:hypothetical protein
MTQIATYNQARSLAHALAFFGIKVKPETFEMTTSGIYIPRWQGYSRIPHHFDSLTGVAEWYFFFRFEGNVADINVGEALDFTKTQPAGVQGAPKINGFDQEGLKKLVAHLHKHKKQDA